MKLIEIGDWWLIKMRESIRWLITDQEVGKYKMVDQQVRNSNFAAFIDVFTANTYVMVIVADSQVCRMQSRALEVFFNFFNNKKWFFAFLSI